MGIEGPRQDPDVNACYIADRTRGMTRGVGHCRPWATARLRHFDQVAGIGHKVVVAHRQPQKKSARYPFGVRLTSAHCPQRKILPRSV